MSYWRHLWRVDAHIIVIAALICVALWALADVRSAAERYSHAAQQARGEREAYRQRWQGAVVVRICAGGLRIYRLRTGEHVTGDDDVIDNIETVCR